MQIVSHIPEPSFAHSDRGRPEFAWYLLLLLVGIGVYATTLWKPPTELDDIRYLIAMSQTDNPFIYFIAHHGHANSLYRPLSSLTLWITYHVFGVQTFPNQLFNLVLHLLTGCILFKTLYRIQNNNLWALIGAAIFLVSNYTKLAPTQVADRPMAFTGVFLALWVDHFVASEQSARRPNTLYMSGLAIGALMSKESGLVVPLSMVMGSWLVFNRHYPLRLQIAPVVAAIVIIGSYFAFRWLLFGSNNFQYTQEVYLLLTNSYYDRITDLPQHYQYWAYFENVSKNMITPIFPVFSFGGTLELSYPLASILTRYAAPLVFVLACKRPLTRSQKLALVIIAVNAIVHVSLFRDRLLYPAQFAYALFVGSGAYFNKEALGGIWEKISRGAMIALLLGNLLWVSHWLTAEMIDQPKRLEIVIEFLESKAESKPILDQILLLYDKPS